MLRILAINPAINCAPTLKHEFFHRSFSVYIAYKHGKLMIEIEIVNSV